MGQNYRKPKKQYCLLLGGKASERPGNFKNKSESHLFCSSRAMNISVVLKNICPNGAKA